MSDLILHHYWQSPVAEKVRVVLGIKQLSWRSVEIPRVPPKPDVTALTGGYRRTPVLQAGADIYCDSQCIIRELDRRAPKAASVGQFVESDALVWALSRWTDGELFTDAIRIVLGSQVDTLDKTFLADRARLYFGHDWTPESISGGVQHSLSQVMTGFSWMNNALHGKQFLGGESPGLIDAFCYHVCWFIRGRFEGGPAMLGAFPELSAWEERVEAIGHGEYSELDSQEAVSIANDAQPMPVDIPVDASGDRVDSPLIGTSLGVKPAGDWGDPVVTGVLKLLGQDEIVLEREDPRAGIVNVHFPRMGYELLPL